MRSVFLSGVICCILVSCNSSVTEEQPAAVTEPKAEDTVATASLPAENSGGSSLPRKLPLGSIRNGDSLSIFRDTSVRVSRDDKSYLRIFLSGDNLYIMDKNNKKVMMDQPRDLNPYIRNNRSDINDKKVVLFISKGTSFRKASITLRVLEFAGMKPTVLAE